MKPFDIAVIAAYFVLMAGVGFWFMRRNKDADAYFREGGRLPWWVVSLSIYGAKRPTKATLGLGKRPKSP